MKGTRKLVFMALLTAMSLCIWLIEAQIPLPIPVPGVKLGLASIITLTAMALLGRQAALCVLLVRIVLSALFAGSFSVILFSLAGGLLSWGIMALTIGLFDEKRLWVVSILGAIGHNAGQLLAAAGVMKSAAVLWYGPALLCAAIITGAFTGAAAMYLIRALRKHLKSFKQD
ncbi:MAG: Gx transporter family protein [Oscillospiraceae bacterium]|nr:Gx transporter family protein [Oscillospiraceae bacterium]